MILAFILLYKRRLLRVAVVFDIFLGFQIGLFAVYVLFDVGGTGVQVSITVYQSRRLKVVSF
jgi:hypothetical protein